MEPQDNRNLQEAKKIVDRCNKCGLCMTSCPVYQQLLVEAASPRGRIQMVKYLLEGKTTLSKRFKEIILTCLLCETCVVNCPSGVRHDQVFNDLRAELVRQYGLDWKKRLVFNLLTHEKLLHASIIFAKLGRNWLVEKLARGMRIGNIPAGNLPMVNTMPFRDRFDGLILPEGKPAGRVFYFTGCFTNYFGEAVGQAVVNILGALQVAVEIPRSEDCCGIASILAGEGDLLMPNVLRNIETLTRAEVDAVLVDCATCGAAFKKEYIDLLRRKGLDTAPAEILKARTQDVMEYIAERLEKLPLPRDYRGPKIRITYHDPCHLVRAQGVSAAPRKILRALPQFEYVEMEEANTCCGGGGSFQFDFPKVSNGITEKKLRRVRQTGARIVVTGCPGCRVTIGGNMAGEDRIAVLHPLELLDMALTGKGLDQYR
jgi:glycolate oxidase iron-sulfur subunit